MKNNFTVKIFNDIENPFLKREWEHLQDSEDVFPQMYYQWITPWWKRSNSGKKLYIITVIDNEQKLVAIAPFCIEKRFGINILQSIPVHFGDFYSFIVKDNNSSLINELLTHINSFKKWSYVKINLIRSNNLLHKKLNDNNYKEQHVENIIEADFSNKSYDDYLMLLHRKVRGEYKRRLRKLEGLGKVEFIISSNFDDYLTFEKNFRRIYELRWKDIDTKLPEDKVYAYRKNALQFLSSKNKALFVLLKLNNELIAYRFGILHQNKYHDYKLSFNTKYHKLGLGSIITGLLIKDLIARKITTLDHGVGDYSYKNDWSPIGKKINMYNFHSYKKNPLAFFYFKFENEYKEKIKKLLKR
jgi:CelD/BcsL family acetyltransferase involved in cellulose biosynthesis